MKLAFLGIWIVLLFLFSEMKEEKKEYIEEDSPVLTEMSIAGNVAEQFCGKNFFHFCKRGDEILAYTLDLSDQYKGITFAAGGTMLANRNSRTALLISLEADKYKNLLSVRYLEGFYIYFLRKIII